MSGRSKVTLLLRRAHELKGQSSFSHRYEEYPIGSFLTVLNKNLSLVFFIEGDSIRDSVHSEIKSNSTFFMGLDEDEREYLDILQKLSDMGLNRTVELLLGI